MLQLLKQIHENILKKLKTRLITKKKCVAEGRRHQTLTNVTGLHTGVQQVPFSSVCDSQRDLPCLL